MNPYLVTRAQPNGVGHERADNASSVLWPRLTDECARSEPLHGGLAGVRSGDPTTAGDPGDFCALVYQCDRSDGDGAAADHPRLLRLSSRAVCDPVSCAG